MIVWKSELFCAVLCTTIVHKYIYTCEQLLNLHVGLGLDFAFVCLFRFTLICMFLVLG